MIGTRTEALRSEDEIIENYFQKYVTNTEIIAPVLKINRYSIKGLACYPGLVDFFQNKDIKFAQTIG